jgi:acylphosphatase
MTNKIGIKCNVTGKVQGVWFRASTQDQAKALGICGYAKNMPDGSVEVVAFGEKDKVLDLFQWLKRGPELAVVKEVSYEEIPFEENERFAVK